MDIKKEIQKLLDSDITGYRIYKETGVDQAVISKLRSGERKIEDLTVSTADKLLKFKGGKKMTRIYKDEDNNLVLSYKGIEDGDYENISLDEFIEIVEEADAWNDIDAEIYESALKEVGLEYGNYDDPDEMWEDFLEEYLKGEKEMTNYGTVTYEGKEYILIQQAYIAGTNEEPYYLATAIDNEGNEYEVEWELNEDAGLVEDESTACDWDAPVDVREI